MRRTPCAYATPSNTVTLTVLSPTVLPTSVNVMVPSGVNDTSSEPSASLASVRTMSSPSGSRQRSSSRIWVCCPSATTTVSLDRSTGGWFAADWSADSMDNDTCAGCEYPPRPSVILYENERVPVTLGATTAWRPAPPRTSCNVTPSPVVGVPTTVMMSPSGSESLSRMGRIVERPARTVTESSNATGGRFAPVRSGLTFVASLLGVSFFAAASAGVTFDQSLMRRIPSVTSQMSPDVTSLRMTLSPLTLIARLAVVDRLGMSETTGDFPGQLVATLEPTTPYTQPLADTGACTTP
jgi:hypothetical protein